MIERWVVKKQSVTYNYHPPNEAVLIKQAIARIKAFQMVEGSISNYKELGYPTCFEVLAWYVLEEHFHIKQFFIDAKEMSKK